jgi:PIN domain nuclease of toxin-antitoxin system
VVLLDASALTALLRDEPAAAAVAEILRDGGASITAVNLAEAMDVVSRRAGARPTAVRSAIAALESVLSVMPVDERLALRAGELRARHYDRSRCAVSIPDCVLLGAASDGDSVATSDSAVMTVAELEGIHTLPLPDSTGRLPNA